MNLMNVYIYLQNFCTYNKYSDSTKITSSMFKLGPVYSFSQSMIVYMYTNSDD